MKPWLCIQLSLWLLVFVSNAWAQRNPCPQYFQYTVDRSEGISGTLMIPPPRVSTEISVTVNLVVPVYFKPEHKGTLNLIEDKDLVIQRLLRGDRSPIRYKIIFAILDPLPTLTEIIVNDETICMQNPGDLPNYTTFTLFSKTVSNTPIIFGSSNYVAPVNNFPTNERPSSVYNKPPCACGATHGTHANHYRPQQIMQPHETIRPTYNQLPSVQTPLPVRKDEFYNPPRPPPQVYQTRPTAPPQRYTTSAPPIWTFPATHQQVTTPRATTQRPQTTSYQPAHPEDNTDQCGESFRANSLIANGHKVNRGAWPWLAAMFVTTDKGLEFNCAGTLVSDKHVITAAHCTASARTKENVVIYLGKHKVLDFIEAGVQSFKLDEMIAHPDYDVDKHQNANDLAVLVLNKLVQFGRFVKPACLLDPRKKTPIEGMVIGWGIDEKGNTVTHEPNEISMPIVSQEQCLRSHTTFQHITTNKTYCAGNKNGAGPCNGDSGGGMFVESDNKWYLRGLVSTAIPDIKTKHGCDLNHYIVFTDVTKYMSWIYQQMGH